MSTKGFRLESHAVRTAEQGLRASLKMRPNMSATQLGSDATSSRNRKMCVGFIGLDPIGEAMASRLLKAGHQLKLYDPARKIPDALQSAGGSEANSIEDACRRADAVFTMLPNDEATEAVILGPGGVVESLPRNAIHIGSSTVSVESADRIVEAHWDAGKQFVSAPVLVHDESTAEVQLFLIAGGREATMIAIEPLLRPIGQLAQLSGWPSDANLVQLDVKCSGANQFQFLAWYLELRARQDRSQLVSPAFLPIQTEGVLQ